MLDLTLSDLEMSISKSLIMLNLTFSGFERSRIVRVHISQKVPEEGHILLLNTKRNLYRLQQHR